MGLGQPVCTAGSHAIAQALASGPMARMRDVGDTSSQPNQSQRRLVSNEEWLLGRPAAARLKALAAAMLQEVDGLVAAAPAQAPAPAAGDAHDAHGNSNRGSGGSGGEGKTKRTETPVGDEPQTKRAKSEK